MVPNHFTSLLLSSLSSLFNTREQNNKKVVLLLIHDILKSSVFISVSLIETLQKCCDSKSEIIWRQILGMVNWWFNLISYPLWHRRYIQLSRRIWQQQLIVARENVCPVCLEHIVFWNSCIHKDFVITMCYYSFINLKHFCCRQRMSIGSFLVDGV